MIDLEEAVPLSAALEYVPSLRPGKRVHVATIHRWATIGCHGVKLETARIGHTRVTTRAAVLRFFARLSKLDGPDANACGDGQANVGDNMELRSGRL